VLRSTIATQLRLSNVILDKISNFGGNLFIVVNKVTINFTLRSLVKRHLVRSFG